MNALSSIVVALTLLLMLAFALLGAWGFLASRRPTAPAPLVSATNAVHLLYALTLLAGLIGSLAGLRQAGKFWEYIGLFVGGGVLYMRGVLPEGWVWRILNDPPNVPRGLMLGGLWNAAAALGYLFFQLSGR